VDVSKRDAKVRIRIAGKGRSWCSADHYHVASTTRHILALRDHWIAEQVSCVVMGATSDHWKRPE
jgi:transposase